jgi:STE24 endopeptidase
LRRWLGWSETAFSLALLLILILSGASTRFISWFHLPVIPLAVVYFLILIVVYELITSPLSYYQGFVLPHRYGLSKQNFKGWLGDLAKGGGIGFIFGSAGVAVAYWLLGNFPDFWWLIAWGLILLVTLLMAVVVPIWLVPLFYKVRPLAEGELKTSLQALAEKAKAKVNGIYTLEFSAKTTAGNAALMGLGKTRRIVISDTLIQNYSLAEIEVVTAHEIGHHMNRDIFRQFIVQSSIFLVLLKLTDVVLGASLPALKFSGLQDPAALPWLVLLFGVFSTLISPLMNAYTRHIESQADIYALDLTRDTQAFKDAMTRLANQNLAVAYPSRWEELLFHDHPSYRQRMQEAAEFEAGQAETRTH